MQGTVFSALAPPTKTQTTNGLGFFPLSFDFSLSPGTCQGTKRSATREVDVFYYDFISLALSKIARKQDRDFRDVKLLVQQGIITLAGLEAAYQEIYPRVGQLPYTRMTQQQFDQRFVALKQLLQNP